MKFFAATAIFFLSSFEKVKAQTANKFFYDKQDEWSQVPASTGTNECARENPSGLGQSPINIDTQNYMCSDNAESHKFFIGDCTIGDYVFSLNDSGLKADVSASDCDKPKMVIPGMDRVYEVLQFHIHTGCENKFNGTGCDAELHIVHVAQTDVAVTKDASLELPDLAVYGYMIFGEDTTNPEFSSLLDSWKQASCSEGNCFRGSINKDAPFNPYSFIPEGTATYQFMGGLTTPPCWEVVQWNLAEKGVKISYRDILTLTNLVNNYSGYRDESGSCVSDYTVASVAGLTSRDVQDLLGRTVTKNCEPLVMQDTMPEAQLGDVKTASASSGFLSRNVQFASMSVVGFAALFLM